ncbi:unnamed protein product [Toxocara canis]|uniref:G_PROTEIN_RECEP_F1_2 domain-containing protein n=1 Tax=Toxocara canis TaxID=6265 RepID=A0A183VA48_TOXCA|nr:unnamed protein product [Toxocara canis]
MLNPANVVCSQCYEVKIVDTAARRTSTFAMEQNSTVDAGRAKLTEAEDSGNDFAVIAITKFNPGGSQFYQRRRFLTVFVLYSIPILILNLPKLISIIFMYVIQPLSPGSRKLIPILRAMNEAVITIEQYRSITTSTCTVLLLNAYRVAAIKVIKGALHWRDNRVKSMSPAFVVRFAHAATK